MGSRVVFGEDAGTIVGGEDEHSINGKEGHVGRHDSSGDNAGDLGETQCELLPAAVSYTYVRR